MKRTNVMVVGLPGNMASLIATKIAKCKDMVLSPVCLTHETFGIIKRDGFALQGIRVPDHENAIRKYKPDVIVDFSKGSPEENCSMFCECGVPFVMGTTGVNMETMKEMVENSNISAVIAPNMATPIVALQAMLEYVAKNFPSAFSGYSLKIEESHQEEKVDTSGTAIAVERLLNATGAVSDDNGILSIRNPLIQERLYGVPKEYLKGHGYHKYSLVSSDGTVVINIGHNINGRNIYVDGTMRAIRFLAKKSDEHGKVFSMTDVLKV
ncbi:MAG: dihydrodipicolinate reductase [Candidatus Pacebacteria bacterium]|nr:dihydrodipicolinate reductase [Candidatus Paceibacterota bacterium]